MRNMSFSKTIEQARDRSKTVTRRWGWGFLNPGDRVQQVVKSMGLELGEKVEKIHVIECVGNRPDLLENITQAECVLEGFPDKSPAWLRSLLLRMKPKKFKGERPNRIEFKYVEASDRSKTCPYALPILFKGRECQYAGRDNTCTGTYGDCFTKGNITRWAGEPAEDECKCPKCGAIGTDDDFDVGGADPDKCFCNNCGAEVPLVSIC